jgi:hypothetical protein
MNKELMTLALEIDSTAEDGNFFELNVLLDKCIDGLETSTAENRPIFHFFIANCYGALAALRTQEPDYEWSWHQNEKISEILCLREAVAEQEFSNLEPLLQSKILTNLGSTFSHLGRFIEAIKSWDAANKVSPNFAMALGNKGIGLVHYSRSLYDYGHAGIMAAHAKRDLHSAISSSAIWDSGHHPEAKDDFRRYYDSSIQYLKDIEYDFDFDLDQWPLGESEDEIDYRGWCLHHRLFLSPLNDICRLTAAARDVIHLPSHSYKIDEDPCFPNFFNLLKQEYITARYMLFEALNGEKSHIADKDVLLTDGFDSVQFGYRSEQLKTAYRLAYSLFDKIALFINDYYSVGLKVDKVNFKSVWSEYNKIDEKFELRQCFSGNKNWPLRGLYYLSKDLYDKGFIDVSLPYAQELASLRNRIEHRFLSLQDYAFAVKNTDTHSYITIDDLEDKTLRIISMAREALIYLSLAMHREEEIRDKDKDNGKLSVPIESTPIKRKY